MMNSLNLATYPPLICMNQDFEGSGTFDKLNVFVSQKLHPDERPRYSNYKDFDMIIQLTGYMFVQNFGE